MQDRAVFLKWGRKMPDTKIFIGDVLKGMGPGLLSGIGDALTDDGDKPKHFEPKDNGGKPMPSYKTGTDRVPKTGPAMLHKDEAVLDKNEAEEYRDQSSHVSLHRALHHLNKGGLHRALGVPEGENIPADKLKAAKNSTNAHVRHMANFASTLKGFKH